MRCAITATPPRAATSPRPGWRPRAGSSSPRIAYAYNPHLPPRLRFDAQGASDRLPELLAIAGARALSAEELAEFASLAKCHEPWLEWSGKREARAFSVEPVSLHIHERVSTQAILKAAARQDVQRDLFADPQLPYREAEMVKAYRDTWTLGCIPISPTCATG